MALADHSRTRIPGLIVGGLVAVGDSLVNGHGDSMAQVPALGWPQWLADAADMSYTRYGRGGATSAEVVRDLLPLVRSRYSLGIVSVGTNDSLRGVGSAESAQAFEAILSKLGGLCDRVAVLSLPNAPVQDELLRAAAAKHGAVVIDGALSGSRLIKPDSIHPTAVGHLVLADRAATALGISSPRALARHGGDARVGASYLINYALQYSLERAKRLVKRVTAR